MHLDKLLEAEFIYETIGRSGTGFLCIFSSAYIYIYISDNNHVLNFKSFTESFKTYIRITYFISKALKYFINRYNINTEFIKL